MLSITFAALEVGSFGADVVPFAVNTVLTGVAPADGIPIGALVVVFLILMPVYVTVAAWLFAEPRNFRTAGIGLVYMGVIAVAMIVSTALLGVGFWLIANLPF